MGEVKSIHESITALNDQLQNSELMKRDLMINRGDLEREIMLKRRAINIDRDRIQLFRTQFPSATALSGY
jgi:tektin-4